MKKLPYRVRTKTGDRFDIDFPLHPETGDAVRVGQLISLLLEVIDFCRIFRQKLLLPKLTVESFGKAVCVKIASAFTMIETRVSDPHCIAQ